MAKNWVSCLFALTHSRVSAVFAKTSLPSRMRADMSKLKKPVQVETAFNAYQLTEVLGEGGAGRVYGGIDSAGDAVAVKVLIDGAMDKRRRFKNETSFLLRNKHKNIVTVSDHGVADDTRIKGAFYVMPRFEGSLREVINGKPAPDLAMSLFSQILDGVEAAHLLNVTHRDLKPENVLVGDEGTKIVIADFGVAEFTEELLHTLVETGPTKRLANFLYAAPEQREVGRSVDLTADIYALGLMLNELFTGSVPHGTEYRLIVADTPEFGFLDPIVSQMIRQNPSERPDSISAVKWLIQKHQIEAVSLQKLSELEKVVIPAGEVDDPLAHQPPKLIGAYHDNGVLYLELDREVSSNWVLAFHYVESDKPVPGISSRYFRFNGVEAKVGVGGPRAQIVIDHFKEWLPKATDELKSTLEREAARAESEYRQHLQIEQELERRRFEVNSSLRI